MSVFTDTDTDTYRHTQAHTQREKAVTLSIMPALLYASTLQSSPIVINMWCAVFFAFPISQVYVYSSIYIARVHYSIFTHCLRYHCPAGSAGCVMKPLQIWLFNDKLVYGRTGTHKKHLFRCTRYVEVPLTHCNAVATRDDDEDDDKDQPSSSLSLSFIFESERESFLIIAKTPEERWEWLSAITTAIDQRLNEAAVGRFW